MKRTLKLVAAFTLLACAALVISGSSTVAKVDPASDLQLTVAGDGAMASPQPACERVTHTRFCFWGTKPTCPATCR